MKKKYIKLQVEEFQSDFEADFDNFDDDDINTFKDNKKLWDY